jgi:hypothetical protein
MEVIIEPAVMTSKFDMKASFTLSPVGEGRCKRVFEGDVKVSIMIVGGQVEKYMIDEMRRSYDIATDVTRRWIAQRKASA